MLAPVVAAAAVAAAAAAAAAAAEDYSWPLVGDRRNTAKNRL